MKATKFTLAASIALAAIFATGDVTASSQTATVNAKNGEVTSSVTGSIPGLSGEDTSTGSLSPSTPDDPTTGVQTFFKDTENNDIAPAEAGLVGSKEIDGYVFVRTTITEEGNMIHVYTGQTTVNFTAQFNDGRPDAQFSWTFPANTEVTYGQLFQLAGLNPEDFNLGDYQWNGTKG